MSWHDCSVHGIRFGDANEKTGTIELELDIDFILEWLCQSDRSFRFRIAPAKLTFHSVFGLRIVLDYVTPSAGMTPFSIDGIERTSVAKGSAQWYRWRLPLNWPTGEITFEGAGFTQVLTREPIIHDRQWLKRQERGG